MKYRFKTPPDPFQKECLLEALRCKRYGVFFQQRVGKTKTAIDYINCCNLLHGITRVIVTCPLTATGVWPEQFKEHSAYPYKFIRLPATEAGRRKLLAAPVDGLTIVCVTHGELPGAVAMLQSWGPQIVVADEVHAFKDPKRKRSKAAYKLTKDLTYVLGLTGTAIPKRPLDLFGIWKIINPAVFGTKITTFKSRYCIMGGFYDKQVVAYVNKDEMSRKIAKYSMRVLRKDVMGEPHVDNLIVPVKLEPSARKIYKDLQHDFLAELDNKQTITADIAAVRMMRLQQICGGFARVDSDDPDSREIMRVSYAKEKALIDMLDNFYDQDEKAVVFFRFIAEIDAIEQALLKLHRPVLVMKGDTSEKERTYRRERFQTTDEPVVMLMQETVGSMSICLDTAHNNVYYSMTFSLVDFQQSRDRVMGRGQQCDVTNWFLAVENSVDHKVMNTLKNDEDLAAEIGDKYRWLIS